MQILLALGSGAVFFSLNRGSEIGLLAALVCLLFFWQAMINLPKISKKDEKRQTFYNLAIMFSGVIGFLMLVTSIYNSVKDNILEIVESRFTGFILRITEGIMSRGDLGLEFQQNGSALVKVAVVRRAGEVFNGAPIDRVISTILREVMEKADSFAYSFVILSAVIFLILFAITQFGAVFREKGQ
jgi:hypothetical protein